MYLDSFDYDHLPVFAAAIVIRHLMSGVFGTWSNCVWDGDFHSYWHMLNLLCHQPLVLY